jgi:hypothetical protein
MPNIQAIPNTVDIASVTTDSNKYLYLPATSSIYGKTITIKDVYGSASSNHIHLYTQGPDLLENGSNEYIIDIAYGYASFFAKSNRWYLLTESAIPSIGGGGGYGISSLSSIISYGLSTVNFTETLLSLSSIISYGLSTVGDSTHSGISSLSSIVSYSISTFSSIIGNNFTTSSIFTNYISSGFSEFSNFSTHTALIGYVNSPLNIDTGIITPYIDTSEIYASNAYFKDRLGIGKAASYLYTLDVNGSARIPYIKISSITGGYFIGDGSNVSNVPTGDISSLSSIITYGLSSLNTAFIDTTQNLSSITSYGLSTLRGNLYIEPNVHNFHDLNIGGTGIKATESIESNDTYTEALAKIDTWLYKNIVDQPPAPTSNSLDIGNSSEGTLVTWKAPFQFRVGSINDNTLFPYIASLTIQISNALSHTYCNLVYGSNYIPSTSNIEGVLIKIGSIDNNIILSNSSYNKNILNLTLKGLTFLDALPLFSINVWYNNYSSNSYNILTFSNLFFSDIGIPSSNSPSSNNINIELINNNSLYVGITTSLKSNFLPTPVFYFKASNIYGDYRAEPSNYIGPFTYSTLLEPTITQINYNAAFYNSNPSTSNITLWIKASNSLGIYETSFSASTGEQCNLPVPIIGDFNNIMNSDGSITTTTTINNNIGLINWYITYKNNYNNTTCNTISYHTSNINYCNSSMLTSNLLQYYSNTVTLNVNLTSNFWISSSNQISNITDPYFLVTPNMCNKIFTSNTNESNKYDISIFLDNNYVIIPINTTIITLWGITPNNNSIITTNNSNFKYGPIDFGSEYIITARYQISDSSGIYFGNYSNIRIYIDNPMGILNEGHYNVNLNTGNNFIISDVKFTLFDSGNNIITNKNEYVTFTILSNIYPVAKYSVNSQQRYYDYSFNCNITIGSQLNITSIFMNFYVIGSSRHYIKYELNYNIKQ